MITSNSIPAPEALIANRHWATATERPINRWRIHLTGMSFLICLALAPSPSAQAQLHEAWRMDSAKDCAFLTSDPGKFEVFIFSGINFTGLCMALGPGLYPQSWQLGLPDNAVNSIKIGLGVRARVYNNAEFGDDQPIIMSPGEEHTAFHKSVISSMRVETADRSETCDDLQSGEIGFSHLDKHGNVLDCIVVKDIITINADGFPTTRTNIFPSPAYIGLKDDSINQIDATKTFCDIGVNKDTFFRDQFPLGLPGGSLYGPRVLSSVRGISSISLTPTFFCF